MTNIQSSHEWLSLIDVSGPFLAGPALEKAFPQGLDRLDSRKKKDLRQAYDEWREAQDLEDDQLPEIHQAWIELVLKQGLELDEDGEEDTLKPSDSLPETLSYRQLEYGVTLRPDYAVVDDQQGDKPLMLISVHGPDVDLDSTMGGDGWAATQAERMVQLCRATENRLGLVTNGERWMLVDAPVGAVTTFASWYARLWAQEPITLQAFVTLLGIRRFFTGKDEQLPALLNDSLKHQDDVTEALGEQVRRAVEVLIQALDRADVDRNRTLLEGVEPSELYEAALTVMMRLVFLLSAEERELMDVVKDERFQANYAVSSLRMQLREQAGLHSEEILSHRRDAWSRLLAIFRAVYGGIEHETLRMPALGGSLFDPDRFPFLEGRAKGTSWKTGEAKPLPIDNRTVLLLLEAIQLFQGRTLSYRALDVENIGYVYEGLLERTVERAKEVTLDLKGGKDAKKTIYSLDEMESLKGQGDSALSKNLSPPKAVKRSEKAIENDLSKVVDPSDVAKLLTACHNDQELCVRVEPYFHLLRIDSWGYPLVYPGGTFLITTGTDRRETGTHYTPKSLTEAIVKETLEPIVYVGPAEGVPREEWKLKSPAELLELKICDPAMGSGAFLVQVCRWLSERLVEGWEAAEKKGHSVTIDGEVCGEIGTAESLPSDSEERVIVARRMIAERCLYGVDINPLAVELAKLSIWLVTLSKGRPFGFLDHNLRSGDSLLGIHDIEQLIQLHPDPAKGDRLHTGLFDHRATVRQAVERAMAIRLEVRTHRVREIGDVQEMARLNDSAQQGLVECHAIADRIMGETLANPGALHDGLVALAVTAGACLSGDKMALQDLRRRSEQKLATDHPSGGATRHPFHWALEFPEVFLRESGGFDAIVGNPPFLGGQRITGTMGTAYRNYLVEYLAQGMRGSADFVAYFFLRVFSLLRGDGVFGLLAVNTIAEGNTREVGLDQILSNGGKILVAYPSEVWPGSANVVTSRVHLRNGQWRGQIRLSGCDVPVVSAHLTSREQWAPVKLAPNKHLVFQGSILLGDGFLVDENFVRIRFQDGEKAKDVLYPYLIGKEVNQSPRHVPGRWVINFFDWPESKAKQFSDGIYQILREKVLPERLLQKDKGAKEKWWLHLRPRPELYHLIGRGDMFLKHPKGLETYAKKLERVLVFATGATKYPCFTFVPNEYIFAHSLCVIASESYSLFACLSSDIHVIWAWEQGSKMKQDLRYTHGDIFETFPFPNGVLDEEYPDLAEIGESFIELRRGYMLANEKGMTKFYNDLHDSELQDSAIQECRKLQVEINDKVLVAYGWTDINPDYGFHEVGYLPEGKNVRFTVSEEAREELLYRLAMLNKERYEEEQQNNQAKTKVRKKTASKTTKAKVYELPTFHERELPKVADDPNGQMELLDSSAAESQPKSTRGNQWGSEPIDQILAWLEAYTGWHGKRAILNGCQAESSTWDDCIEELLEDSFIEVRSNGDSLVFRAKG